MPSQPFSASCCQNSGVTASSVAIIRRTKVVGHSLSRNLRAVSRNNSCSSLKPISMALSLQRHSALDDAAVHDPPVFVGFEVADGAVQQAAIVPHHQISQAPAMGVDELPLRRVF